MGRYDIIHEVDTIQEVKKFNPYHDAMGRFSTANGAASFTIRTRDPAKQGLADRAREREKQRTESGGGTDGTSSGKPKSVKEAKDFSSLQTYMQETYSVTVSDSVGALDYTSVNESVQGMEFVMTEFPQAQGVFKRVDTKNMSAIMSASGTGTIYFNTSYFEDREKALSVHPETPSHPKGNSCFSSGAHETGHLLERALCAKYEDTNLEQALAWRNGTYAKKVVSKACKNAKKQPDGKGKKNDDLIKQVSGYAYKGKAPECLAEAVADYSVNGENAALLSKEIWKILKGELG